jgi:membrane associated rhomboid family serine protease
VIPFFVDVPMRRVPYLNFALITATCAVSVLALKADPTHTQFALWKGTQFRPVQLVSHMFLHADWLHLGANMLFLWVFGNAVNAKLGHVWYLPLYLVLGLAAAVGWLVLGHGKGMVGASGAVMGLCGVFLVLYPRNDVAMWDELFAWWQGEFIPRIPGIAFVGLYLAFDVWDMCFNRHEPVAFAAHVVGGLTGIGLAIGMLVAGWVEPDEGEQTLLDWVEGRPPVSRHNDV